eukprot:CAMPEP_0170472242 /NCGR_PEP_ID=MMETSP0123-20130129/14308_1 /TAXON_ID=182087 /ORGANISM="Favella ehrenbergii, Strain Fehren 1" /LENGTH=95 /DNA_ID=CAMNT_0010740387 /DNA_START=399 /DNA_END=686 /DNA_ORIENTATION=-
MTRLRSSGEGLDGPLGLSELGGPLGLGMSLTGPSGPPGPRGPPMTLLMTINMGLGPPGMPQGGPPGRQRIMPGGTPAPASILSRGGGTGRGGPKD